MVDQPDNTGTLMCRYILSDGTAITVRNKGILKLEGNAVCAQLAAEVSPSP